MLKWAVGTLIAGVVGGVSYVVGRHRGGRQIARRMLDDRTVGRQVLERLAAVHGAKLELFDMPGMGEDA